METAPTARGKIEARHSEGVRQFKKQTLQRMVIDENALNSSETPPDDVVQHISESCKVLKIERCTVIRRSFSSKRINERQKHLDSDDGGNENSHRHLHDNEKGEDLASTRPNQSLSNIQITASDEKLNKVFICHPLTLHESIQFSIIRLRNRSNTSQIERHCSNWKKSEGHISLRSANNKSATKRRMTSNCRNISNITIYFVIYYMLKLFLSLPVTNVNQTTSIFKEDVKNDNSAMLVSFFVGASEVNPNPTSSNNINLARLSQFTDRNRSSLYKMVNYGTIMTQTNLKSPLDNEKQEKRPSEYVKTHLESQNGRYQHHEQHRHHRRRRHHQNHHHHKPETQAKYARARRHYENYYETSGADRPVVGTHKGLVRGVTQKIFTGKFVDAFLGIPYAQPPVGRYRFRHPQPINPWEGELDASRMSSSCYQVNDTFFGPNFLGTSIWNANTPLSEDCLYLNIWTPFGIANTTTVVPNAPNRVVSSYRSPQVSDQSGKVPMKRPVLVWIFGGGFYSGTSTLSLYEGGVLASEEDIVVVSMNYRVSALGFLYFARPDSPGNAGLFDQLMALQWINDNIDQFGGDPDRVTIFGESAGAVSVAFHLLSPLSRNLFSQAILQSGAATCPWGFMESNEIMTNGLQLASSLNCPSKKSELDATIDCLLKADPMALVSQEIGQSKTILNFPFVPVVDGSFLLESPHESLMKFNFKRARILLGSNYDEGNSFLIYLPEFSHCPVSSSNGDNGQQQQERQQSQQQAINRQSVQQAAQDSMQQGVNNEMVGELRDQASQSLATTNIESLELIAPSRQTYSSSQANSNTGGGSDMSRASENQLYISNDSKPCKPNEYLSLTREDFFRVLKDDLNPYAEHPIGKDAIVFEYSNWNNPQDSVSNYDALDKIVGDYYFTCHVNEFALRYATAGNAVYMYYFKQRSSMSPWPKWMGVLHADEINFVFGEPLNPMYNYTTKEVELSRRMMKYWANFAKYGNPTKTLDNSSMPIEKWPEYADKRQYFELHSEFIRIGRGPRAKQCEFWSHYLPKLLESFDRNQCPAPHPNRFHLIHPVLRQDQVDSNQQRRGLLSNVPSAALVSLSVINVLIIICLLVVYAKRKWRLDWSLSSNGNSED